MEQKDLYEKVQLLKAGQVVEIAGDWFRAVRNPKPSVWKACELCELDSICRGEIAGICYAMDFPYFDEWYLELAHP